MNKLRILPLAFVYGFLWPAFASAACLPSQVCWVTSGTTVVTSGLPPKAFAFPFNFAGNDFSASGVFDQYGNFQSVFLRALTLGESYDTSISGGYPTGTLEQIDLTVNGVPWGIPAGGDAFFSFSPPLLTIAGAGTFSVPFTFAGDFTGTPEPFLPGLGCDVLNCVTLNFRGSGIVTYDVEGTSSPTVFGVQQETFTFRAPEPATLSLFAAGLVALVMRRKAVAALHMS